MFYVTPGFGGVALVVPPEGHAVFVEVLQVLGVPLPDLGDGKMPHAEVSEVHK